MSVLTYLYICVPRVYLLPTKTRKGHQISQMSYDLPCRCWQSNWGPLEVYSQQLLHVLMRMVLIVSAFSGEEDCLREKSRSRLLYNWETFLFCSCKSISKMLNFKKITQGQYNKLDIYRYLNHLLCTNKTSLECATNVFRYCFNLK